MAALFFFGIEHCPFPVGFAVVLELQSIAADKSFGRTDKAAQRLLIILNQMLIHRVGRVARHNQQNRNLPLVAAGCSRLYVKF